MLLIIRLIVVFILLTMSYLPIFQLFPITKYISVFLACSILSDIIIRKRGHIATFEILITIFILYTTLFPLLLGNFTLFNRYVSLNEVFVFMLIYSNGYLPQKECRKVVIWSLPFVLATAFFTLKQLLINPFATRLIKNTHNEFSQTLHSQGAGGYNFIYFLLFVLIILFFIIKNYPPQWKKLIRGILVLAFMFMSFPLLRSQYFTALVLFACGIAIIMAWGQSVYMRVVILSAVLIFSFFAVDIIMSTFDVLIPLVGHSKTSARLLDLQHSLQYGVSATIIDTRSFTLIKSLETIAKYPIRGLMIGYEGKEWLDLIGQHSTLLDTFSLFGIPMTLLYIYILFKNFWVRAIKNSELFSLNIAICVAFGAQITMNNLTPSIGAVVFFVYPVVYDWLGEAYLGKKIEVGNVRWRQKK